MKLLGMNGHHRSSSAGYGFAKAMHVHTIYRDPTNDYGLQLTGAK